MSNLVLDDEFLIRADGYMLDSRESYLLASDWFINNIIEWCMESVDTKGISNEKYNLYCSFFATDHGNFQDIFIAKIISSPLIVS